jgi:hypothetical protein
MRNRFDEQLYELNREIIEMGAMCEEAIASAAKALTTGDMELAGRVKANSSAIDQMERDIEGRCMKLLLHQQPVARDLRLISAALKILPYAIFQIDGLTNINDMTICIFHQINPRFLGQFFQFFLNIKHRITSNNKTAGFVVRLTNSARSTSFLFYKYFCKKGAFL